jgi:hypothetical protein
VGKRGCVLTSYPDKAKWWRPRFTVRTLAIFITLICLFFGGWEGTKRRASYERVEGFPSECIGPFVIARDWSNWSGGSRYRREYHVWLLGPTVKLPYEREFDDFYENTSLPMPFKR